MIYVILQVMNFNDTKTQNIRMAKGILRSVKFLN